MNMGCYNLLLLTIDTTAIILSLTKQSPLYKLKITLSLSMHYVPFWLCSNFGISNISHLINYFGVSILISLLQVLYKLYLDVIEQLISSEGQVDDIDWVSDIQGH